MNCAIPLGRLVAAGLLMWLSAAAVLAQPAALTPTAESASGATARPTGRPRIGLVLSGGGARGLAHVGVLKVLEREHVPIDVIAGTSMGAIIGGLYASGMSAEQLEAELLRVNWDAVFAGRVDRQLLSQRRKEEDFEVSPVIEIGMRDGELRGPLGALSGRGLETLLRRYTLPVRDVKRFDALPIPFRAVASDIETGEAVVLSHGSLARAYTVVGAVPGALPPVIGCGRLLVDGGIANNLPIDEARKLCGDVIIAVNISTPALKRQEITSALSVAGQLINFLGKERVDRQLATLSRRDVLIQPALGDISAGSFVRMPEAIEVGEAAARSKADELRRYSLPPAEYQALRKRQIVARSDTLGRIDEIRFEGIERTNSAVLSQLMDTKAGDEVTEESLTRDLRRIYGRGDFDSVDYRIEEGPGTRALIIRVREKETGPSYVRFGLTLATESTGESYFNLLASYRRTWVNQFGAEWKLETQLGQNSYVFTEFYQPLSRYGALFVAPYAQAGQSYRNVYDGDDRVAEYTVRENRLGLDAGANFGQWGELRLGPVWRTVKADVSTGSAALPEVDTDASGFRIRLFADRLDQVWFPREGQRLVVSGFRSSTAMAADSSYSRGEVSFLQALSWGEHTFQAGVYGGTNFDTSLPAYEAFVLGGPFRLSAYSINQFSGQQAAFGTVRYLRRLLRAPIEGVGGYFGASLEVGRVNKLDDGRDTTGKLQSASVFVGANTLLGPVWLGGGFASGRQTLFLLLGLPWI